jgi:hypothetical protein
MAKFSHEQSSSAFIDGLLNSAQSVSVTHTSAAKTPAGRPGVPAPTPQPLFGWWRY